MSDIPSQPLRPFQDSCCFIASPHSHPSYSLRGALSHHPVVPLCVVNIHILSTPLQTVSMMGNAFKPHKNMRWMHARVSILHSYISVHELKCSHTLARARVQWLCMGLLQAYIYIYIYIYIYVCICIYTFCSRWRASGLVISGEPCTHGGMLDVTVTGPARYSWIRI